MLLLWKKCHLECLRWKKILKKYYFVWNIFKFFFQDQDQSLWVKCKLPLLGTLRFNPIVSFVSIGLIWIFVGICVHYGENVPFKEWKTFIVGKFTWLYIGSQDLWAVFAIILYFRHGPTLQLTIKTEPSSTQCCLTSFMNLLHFL